VADVEDVLRTPTFSEDEHYVFASDRHADLVAALGVPSFSVGLGYRYIEMGAFSEDLDPATLRHVG
jgi:hypothetical protein